MRAFLIRRIVQAALTLWVVWSLVFVLYFIVPEDPARTMVGRAATPAMIQRITQSLGLDQPLWRQYLGYFGRILHGDLGYSFSGNVPVAQVITHAIPVDISLAVPAALIWLGVGVGIGVAAARRPSSRRARFASLLVFAGMSIPTFLVGTSLVFIFNGLLVHGLGLFPLPGETWTPITASPLEWAHGLVLPWITLGLASSATYVRLSRGSFRDVLGEDYITAARARGISERRILYVHALRVAAAPLLTQFGVDFAAVLGGVVVTEMIFGLPGLGRTLINAVQSQDLPVAEGVVIVVGGFVVVVNTVVDCLYGVLDRRVHVT